MNTILSSSSKINVLPGFIISDKDGIYATQNDFITENEIIRSAKALLKKRLTNDNDFFTSPETVKDFLMLEYSAKEHECFVVLFLNNQHKLIKAVEMFNGTIDSASVYPREILKTALQLNAAAVILSHNHPSGITEPSQADKSITTKIKSSLSLIDIRVLDHIIIGAVDSFSFSEGGLL